MMRKVYVRAVCDGVPSPVQELIFPDDYFIPSRLPVLMQALATHFDSQKHLICNEGHEVVVYEYSLDRRYWKGIKN